MAAERIAQYGRREILVLLLTIDATDMDTKRSVNRIWKRMANTWSLVSWLNRLHHSLRLKLTVSLATIE
jgi:hypothetical protein